MEKVNDYWLSQKTESGDCAWERGAYFIGNMAAYRRLGKKEYLDYAIRWANDNGWRFHNDPDYNTENADDLICGQTYLDLIAMGVEGATDKHMIRTINNLSADKNNEYWWWVDTIYMALPLFYRMAKLYNNDSYAQKGYKLYMDTKVRRKLFDENRDLWYRDERFYPGGEFVPNGEEIFWGRGNGWIFAGIARTLEYLTPDDEHYGEYSQMLVRMAGELRKYQQNDGFWRCNIKVPSEYDVPETSATLLIAYGMMVGVRLGILDEDYAEIALKAYNALNEIAVFEDGKIGYVQGVAWGPTPIEKEITNDYAVGTYLLLSDEIYRKFYGETV